MEFNEKLNQLRKSNGLTQEDLAEALYVSRTAVSKWESGRGYPNIESLKDIATLFSVSIDDLLSGEKLISIAQKENKSNIRNLCDLLFGVADLLSVMLIILPLYPDKIDEFVYSVNLLNYTQVSDVNIKIYWALYIILLAFGVLKVVFSKLRYEKYNKFLIYASIIINVISVLFLALTREVYAVVVAFLLLFIKTLIFIKYIKGE